MQHARAGQQPGQSSAPRRPHTAAAMPRHLAQFSSCHNFLFKMAEGFDPKKEPLTSPASFKGLTNDQLMEIAEHPEAFSQFCSRKQVSNNSTKSEQQHQLTPVRNCSSFSKYSASCEEQQTSRLKRYLMVRLGCIFNCFALCREICLKESAGKFKYLVRF